MSGTFSPIGDSKSQNRWWSGCLPQLMVFAIFAVVAVIIAVDYERDRSNEAANRAVDSERSTGTAISGVTRSSDPVGQSTFPVEPPSPTSLPPTATMEPPVTPTVENTPTPSPTPTAEVADTPTPLRPTPTASPAADMAAQLVRRVVSAEEQLKTGHLEATVESEQGVDSSASITFDLGDATHSPRMHFVSSYTSEESQRTTELISIGDTFWERINGEEWVEVDAREGVWGQVQGHLPGVSAIADTGLISVEDNRLTWFDSVRDIDVTLQVDVTSGIPQQLRRASRSTDTVVIVTYSDWNAPVDIQPPLAP